MNKSDFIDWLQDKDPDEPVGNPLYSTDCPLARFYREPITNEFIKRQGWAWSIDWQCRFIRSACNAYYDGRRMLPQLDQLSAREALNIMENL
jgi:hypothetical protein